MIIKVGDTVRIKTSLDTPEEARFHGEEGEVAEIWPDGTVLVLFTGDMAYLSLDEIESLEEA